MGRFPDFLIVGAPKCATTWLSAMLSTHPDVWMPFSNSSLNRPPELYYFGYKILNVPLRWYSALFEHADANGKIVGEKTPDYVRLSRRSIALIRRLMPEVKIIILLRRPDERAWSEARMRSSNYNLQSLDASRITSMIVNTGKLRNVKRTDYLTMLDKWLEYFPPEQVFVGFVDEIKNNPNKVLEQVYGFIGVDTQYRHEKAGNPVWASPKVDMPEVVRWYLQRRYRPMILELSKRYPKQVEQWLDPDPSVMKISLLEKAKTLVLAYVFTIPVNIVFLVHHLIKDLRMTRRLRLLESRLSRSSPQGMFRPIEHL
jgi:hypothetical protein